MALFRREPATCFGQLGRKPRLDDLLGQPLEHLRRSELVDHAAMPGGACAGIQVRQPGQLRHALAGLHAQIDHGAHHATSGM